MVEYHFSCQQRGKNSIGENVVKKQMMKEGQFLLGTTPNTNSDEIHDLTLNAIFSSSKVPIQLIKQNNVMILSVTKKLLSDKFIKQGIFETLWLTVIYWNKVNL